MVEERSKTYIYSKRENKNLFLSIPLIMAIVGMSFGIIVILFMPGQINPEIKDSDYYLMFFIEGCFMIWFIAIILLGYFLRKLLIKRELKINRHGIEYKVGKRSMLNNEWNKFKLIRNRDGAKEIIEIFEKDKDWPFVIRDVHPKERIEAFKKMAEYARKYDIKIDDQLGYLNK
jgi:hypothetical protein